MGLVNLSLISLLLMLTPLLVGFLFGDGAAPRLMVFLMVVVPDRSR
jgi:hypothetical protein